MGGIARRGKKPGGEISGRELSMGGSARGGSVLEPGEDVHAE